jgi:hypothetical protein
VRRLTDELARRLRGRQPPAAPTPASTLAWTTRPMQAKVDLDDANAVADAVADAVEPR